MIATCLKCSGLYEPMGIDLVEPKLSWNCEGGVAQTAYQLVVEKDGVPVWDTGCVESASMAVAYAGEKLGSRDAVTWRVRVWDEVGEVGEWSEDAHFELGLIGASDWRATWVAGDYDVDPKKRYPVDCFRRAFAAAPAKLQSARLYITACGIYEARINGRRAGEFAMAPGHTDYRKRVQCQVVDVAELLEDGQNVLTVELADGWYRGSCGANGIRNQYGEQTKLLAQLELVYADGDRVTVCSGPDWEWSADGPIRFADNKDGEVVDARMEPSYSGHARAVTHDVVPTASNNVPVVEAETFSPTLVTTPSGARVLDFGQNIAGFVAFRLPCARAGQTLRLRMGEMLDEAGEFTQANIQTTAKDGKKSPLQEVTYTCKDGENAYKTRFAVFGFQYVLVEGDAEWAPEDFTAIAVHSDLERTGWFESSNELLDKFVENTVWSAKNNFLDVPTDCPTRERHGWTGDAQLFCRSAGYLFDYVPFANKYLNDIYDLQQANGNLPEIAPEGGEDPYMKSMCGSAGWSDAGILIPYWMWKLTGDLGIVDSCWDGMCRYFEFLRGRIGKRTLLAKPTGLHGEDRRWAVNVGQSYGEWAEPDDIHLTTWTEIAFPHAEVSTAYTAYMAQIMAELADELGHKADAIIYRHIAKKVTGSYQALRRRPAFTLDTDRQADLVRPLYLGLLDREQAEFAQARLIKALEHYGWRLGTGFLSTPFILYVLADYDLDAAYRLLQNEECPGWLFMPKTGANTIWESWEGPSRRGADGTPTVDSLDHYSKGALVEWLFSSMCGIVPAGERHFDVKPLPGGDFTGARAAYLSAWGRIESGWTRDPATGATSFTLTVPANCSVTLTLPDGSVHELAAGTWEF